MHPKSPKLLDDVMRSCHYFTEDTRGKTLANYLDDRRLRQVVERNLGMIGEALYRLRTIDPETAERIANVHQIIGLRNRLAHGYDDEIDDALIWRTVQESIPIPLSETESLLPPFDAE